MSCVVMRPGKGMVPGLPCGGRLAGRKKARHGGWRAWESETLEMYSVTASSPWLSPFSWRPLSSSRLHVQTGHQVNILYPNAPLPLYIGFVEKFVKRNLHLLSFSMEKFLEFPCVRRARRLADSRLNTHRGKRPKRSPARFLRF